MALDPSGNVWVANSDANTVVEFTQAQLATVGAPAPTVTLTATDNSLDSPTTLAFDRCRRPVGDQRHQQQRGRVHAEPAGGLRGADAQGHDHHQRLVPASIDAPASLAFDGSGNLWVGNGGNKHHRQAHPGAAQRHRDADACGDPDLQAAITAPDSLAFDRSGNLWVANNLDPGQRGGVLAEPNWRPAEPRCPRSPSRPTPPTSTDPTGSPSTASGTCGWATASGNSVTEFSPAQLAASGTPTPITTLSGAATGPVRTGRRAARPGHRLHAGRLRRGHLQLRRLGLLRLARGLAAEQARSWAWPASPDGLGYWLVASDGGIFNFGDAGFYGSHGGSPLNKPVVGMAATPDGKGYWLVASDGGIFTYGDAGFYGSHGGSPLNKPIVGMAATGDGGGYWLVASDGGIFNYGDASFFGSHGGSPLNKPIVGMAATPDSGGYWLVASDGGIFTYGDAGFYGSAGSIALNKPIVGMAATPDGGGYWLVASDGGIFTYGDAGFFGSHGGSPLNKPIVAMTGPYG